MIRCNEININNNVKYNDLILESLKKTALKRVRIKVDPALVTKEADFSRCDGYEGYVLEEGKGHLKILVINPELGIEDIPIEFIEAIADQADYDSFCLLKEYIIKSLLHDGKTESDPIIEQIRNSNNINDIEQYIIQCGYNSEKLAQLYKNFLMNDEI